MPVIVEQFILYAAKTSPFYRDLAERLGINKFEHSKLVSQLEQLNTDYDKGMTNVLIFSRNMKFSTAPIDIRSVLSPLGIPF